MKKILIFCLVSVTTSLFAQEYVHQVIVVNEGYYDYQTSTIIEPVTIGTFDPSTNLYSTMDTLYDMRFASDALLDEGYLYIAADSKIYKYDMNSFDLITSVEYSGVRNLGIWGNNLIASRGEYLTSYDSYLNIFDKFYRVNKERSRAIGGSGLGLTIVKQVIDGHKGNIHVKSKPGNTVFTFLIPQ